ncbi:MAG: hypothetical protein O7C75_12980 [Verrucomicrobia bacterium]|nr:hypothetical protein [Verrucomicrobiota bacterium]
MKTLSHLRILEWIWVSAILMITASAASAQGSLYGVQNRASSPQGQDSWQLFNHINDDSTVANPNSALFVIAGGIYGAAFKDDVFHGVELENGTSKEFLVTIPHEGDALGSRVSENEIGFSDIEGLANVEGQLMGISLDFPGHVSRLISINHETGVGTLIGQGSFNVIIRGLAYDPIAKILYGVGIPWGAGETAVNENNLYIISTETGATTLVGDLGTRLESLAWTATLGLVGSFDHLYQINTSTGVATQIGTTDYTNGLGTPEGSINGIWALAGMVNFDDVEVTPFSITSIALNNSSQAVLAWESESGFTFHVECNPSLDGETWIQVSESLSGQPTSMNYTVADPETLDPRFYRVIKSFP